MNSRSFLIVIFLVSFVIFRPVVHGTDTMGYYSWLRSAVIDGDLDVANEYAHYDHAWMGRTTVTGHRDNPYAIGSAILWSPFYLAAHGLSLASPTFGLNLAADGYAPHYVVAVSLASVLYAFAGLLLTHRIACQFFNPRIATLAVSAIWLASPLLFYQYSHPVMSHANDFFAYALFLFVWHRTRRQRTPLQYAFLGMTAALAALVRNQNAVLVILPLLEIVVETVRRWPHTDVADRSGRLLKSAFFRAFSLCAGWWLAFLPQMFVWRTVFGSWIVTNPYASSANGSFDILHPHLLDVLLSTNHGLFVWTPLMLPAVMGWLPLWRKDRRLTALLVSSCALQLYVIASWSSWSGSASFGQRFFTNMMPAFALGLAALLNVLQRRIRFQWLVIVCGLFIIWNGLLIVRYVVDDIPHTGPVPLRELIIGQFTVIPRHLSRIVQILITRE